MSVIFCVVCRAVLEEWQHSVSNDHNCSFVAATISIIVNCQSVSPAGHSVGVFHSILMRSVACRVVVDSLFCLSAGAQHFLMVCFQPFLVAFSFSWSLQNRNIYYILPYPICRINDIVAFFFVHCSAGEGDGAFNKVLYEESPPQMQPLTLLYTIFGRKCIPFLIPSIGKWYPFHMSSLKHCISFNRCKFIVLEVCWLFQSDITRPFTDHNDRYFHILSYPSTNLVPRVLSYLRTRLILQLVKFLPSYLNSEKGSSSWG